MSKRAKATNDTSAEDDSKNNFPVTWKDEGEFVHGDSGTKPSEKILSFDMDDTLIKVKSGAKFAKDKNDWIIWHEKVVSTIKDYYAKGYKIMIMTNQAGVEKGHTKIEDIKHKIQNLINHIGVPIQVMIAPITNYYRKPSIGFWTFLDEKLNGGIKTNRKESIYCGDAAGRAKTGSRKADHENTDYKFALNCGVQFKTPEMLYLDAKETLPPMEFEPKSIKKTGKVLKGKDKVKGAGKEMIIFVGSPGAGKSTFYHNHLSDYVHVNNDTLKTKQKCLKVAEEGLSSGKSVVIDNTNPKAEARADYIALAKKYKYPVRAFHFDVSKEAAFHMNDLRKYNIHRKHATKSVPKVIIHTWYKNFEMPTKKEGFDEIDTVELIAGPFDNNKDEELFFCYISAKK